MSQALLAEARHYIRWADAVDHDGRFVPNRNAPLTPAANLIPFPLGPISNESGANAPLRTHDYTGCADPRGAHRALLLGPTTAASQVHYLHRSSTCPPLPAGQYALRFRARSAPGSGPWAVQFGLTTAYGSAVTADAALDDPAHAAETTFTRQITYAGSGDIALRLPATGTQVLVCDVQLEPGLVADLPPLDPVTCTGARRGNTVEGVIPLDVDGNFDTRGLLGGAWLLEPGLETYTYEAITVLVVHAFDELPGTSFGFALCTPKDAALGTANTTFAIGIDTAGPFAGEFTVYPTGYRGKAAQNVLGGGLVIVAQTRSATTRAVYFGGIPTLTEAKAFAPIQVQRWCLAAYSGNAKSDQQSFQAFGRQSLVLIWPRDLSAAEVASATATLRDELRLAGAPLLEREDFDLIESDSNGTRATGDWTQIISSAGYMAPGENIFLANNSVGGHGLSEIEGPTGRWELKSRHILLAAAESGLRARYTLAIGTNDPAEIAADPAAYFARVQALIAQTLALHPMVEANIVTLPPIGYSANPPAGFEAGRLVLNQLYRDWVAANPCRMFLTDFGLNDTIGDPVLQAQPDQPYYLMIDRKHFSPAGDIAAAALWGASTSARRAYHAG